MGTIELFSDSASVDKGPTIFAEGFILRDLKTGTTCQADEGITTRVFQSQNRKHLLFESYSGSMTDFRVIDTNGCVERGHLSHFTSGLKVSGNQLRMEPACECTSATLCQCDPGGIYALDADCHFHRMDKETRETAQAVLGVAISKEAWIAFPRTKKAAVVPPPHE